MRCTTVLNRLFRSQGAWIRGVEVDLARSRLVLDVVPRVRRRRCGRCGRRTHRLKDRQLRYWRHLDLLGLRTFLRYRIWRVFCRHCGVLTQAVPWASSGSRFTAAFEREVAWLVQRADLTAVAQYFRISWRSVRRILGSVITAEWDQGRQLSGLHVIGVDEISYRRRHKYLTVVVDHLSGRVVWAGQDRRAKTLLRFFRLLGRQRSAELDAVSTDMWDPYVAVIRKKAPQACIIFDRFHIVQHLNRAVDDIRRQLVRSTSGEVRRDLKHTKFPLLRARWHRSGEDERVLEEQVRANRPLYRAVLLKDDFMDLYTYRREKGARRFLLGWLRRAMRSGLGPMQRVARMLRQRLEGVVGWVTWRISNGRLEGMNNRIRLLSHRSYGLHSAEALISLVYLCCGGINIQRAH